MALAKVKTTNGGAGKHTARYVTRAEAKAGATKRRRRADKAEVKR